MVTITIPKIKYEEIIRRQRELSQKIEKLSAKLEVLSKMKKFEEITSWGRKFAKERKIKLSDVLIND